MDLVAGRARHRVLIPIIGTKTNILSITLAWCVYNFLVHLMATMWSSWTWLAVPLEYQIRCTKSSNLFEIESLSVCADGVSYVVSILKVVALSSKRETAYCAATFRSISWERNLPQQSMLRQIGNDDEAQGFACNNCLNETDTTVNLRVECFSPWKGISY